MCVYVRMYVFTYIYILDFVWRYSREGKCAKPDRIFLKTSPIKRFWRDTQIVYACHG